MNNYLSNVIFESKKDREKETKQNIIYNFAMIDKINNRLEATIYKSIMEGQEELG